MKTQKRNTIYMRWLLLAAANGLFTTTALSYDPVLLDPGHGGSDWGASGGCGIIEKNFNLTISNKSYDLIQSDLNCPWFAYTTRHTDATISDYNDRWRMANNVGGNWRDSRGNLIPSGGVLLFISIHANSATDPSARGTEVYYYEGNDLRSRRSKNVAVLMLQMYIRHTRPAFASASSRGIKQDDESGRTQIGVLRYTIMPAILVETEFISNTTYCSIFSQATYKDSASGGIKQGVCWTYASPLPPAPSPYYVDLEMISNFSSGTYDVGEGQCFVARNVTRRVTNNYFVEGSSTRLNIEGSFFGDKALAVVDDRLRVRARNGGYIYIGFNTITVLGEGAELIPGSGATLFDGGGPMAFLGQGSCVGIDSGTYILGANATRIFDNGGIFAFFRQGTMQLESGSQLIIGESGTWVINSPMQMTFGPGSRIIVRGTVLVNENVTLSFPPSSNIVLEPNARVEMGNNSSIAVAGQLSAIGNQESPIVFTLRQGASSWNGIVADNSCQANVTLEYCTITGAANALLVGEQAHFTMDNCTIDNSSIGVQITPFLGDCPGVPAAKYITNNTITDVGMGIFLNTVAETHISNNIILGQWSSGNQPQELSAGIRCVGSSPKMLGNRIEGFGYGLHAMDGSSPELEDGFSGGHNVIRNNYIGVKCQDESHAVLGFLSGAQWDEGGQNSIYGNEWRDVVLVDKSVVFAQNNWWGSPEDPSAQFFIEDGSELFYQPWLDHDPNEGNRPYASGRSSGMTRTSSLLDKESSDPRLSPFPDLMRQALAERMAGRHAEAFIVLRLMVANRQLPAYAHRFIFSTGDIITGETQEFFKSLGPRLIHKPFAVQEILHKIRAVASHPSSPT